MKRVLVKSVYSAFDYVMEHYYPEGLEANAERKDTYAVISIQDTHTGGFGFIFSESNFCKGVLTLYFDDIVKEVPGAVLFDDEMAEKIISFIIEHEMVDTLLVHCYAGQSRSRAVGAFAVKMSGGDNSRYYKGAIMCSAKKKVVFIEYDLRKGQLLAPMYAILIDRALANALGGRQQVKTNKYFLLDEMLLLPKLDHLSDGLNFGRSLGVKVMCGLQNTCGLEEQYGEAGAKNILSSFQNMVAFRTNDYDTRQFVINRLGENYQNFSLSAQQANLNIQRAGHTVEDWNILKLKNGEAVVSLAGEDPFLFTMPLYR